MVEPIIKFLNDILINLMGILPNCPLEQFINFKDTYNLLGALNYFVPFDLCVAVLEVWVDGIAAYYAYRKSSAVLGLFGFK